MRTVCLKKSTLTIEKESTYNACIQGKNYLITPEKG